MKKLLVVLAAAGLLFAMSSCKKECTCTSYDKSGKELPGTTYTQEIGGNTGYKNCAQYQDDLDKASVGVVTWKCE